MSWRISIMIFVLILLSCKQQKTIEINGNDTTYLIEAKGLENVLNDKNIKVLDFRKKEFYNKEHIPGSLNIWRTDIEDDSYPYKGIMPSQLQIETLFGKLGISTNDTIIVYDDNGLCEASRLWWILQNYDFNNIKMLHGGLSKWKENGGQVTTEVTELEETVFELTKKPKMKFFVSKNQVSEALITNVTILDTRTIDEFSGKRQKKGAAKGGRIPNSIHLDWAESIDYNGDKRIKSLEDLESIYSKLNIKKNEPVILYCHSGVRSAHTTFVLTQLLGYKNVKNYDGSWTEWSYFNDLPFESDSVTRIKN